MKNMFKDAYFGKQYITKSNKKSIFWNTTPEGDYILIREDVFKVFVYDKGGRDITGDSKNDIDSELKISEKELDKLAEDASYEAYQTDEYDNCSLRIGYYNGFKDGYREKEK